MRRTIRIALAMCLGLLQVSMAAPLPSRDADLVNGMDRSVRPGDDFFAYANGAWLASTEIPADRGSYGLFAQLSDVADERVSKLLQEPHAPAQGRDAAKAAEYYATFMDAGKIDIRGLAGLQPELDRIAAITDVAQLSSYLGGTLRADVDILNSTELHTDHLLGVWVAQDLDDPTRYAPFLVQGGLGLPDRDYYLADSARMKDIRTGYQSHITAMLALAGTPAAEAGRQAAEILALEERIAKVHVSRAETEDVKRGDNHWKRQDFAARAPGIDWERFLTAAQLPAQQDFVVWQPGAVTGISALVASEPVATWKAYLRFHALDHFAFVLPTPFVEESFSFHGKALQGAQQLRPRWKRAVAATNAALGDAVGRLYAERYFPPAAKARIEALVHDLLASFAVRIDSLSWMAPATKREAKAKLAALKVGVGYPDHWRDYGGLSVVPGDALGNAQRAEEYAYHRAVAKLGKPVDRSEWAMEPQQVNAVNLPAMNALNFPAAILQPPFFDPGQSAARNYGGIGAVIGHEISHSFDDQGALFDARGRLRNWWLPDDFAHFRAAGEQLARQYDGYKPFPDLAVNGQQTLSENIADLAGLSAAHSAYRQRAAHESPAADVAGFGDEQQFFISFAQCMRGKEREPALRRQIVTDGHAPSMYRASTVRNIDEWYATFDVKPGERLYLAPDARVRVW
jgi:putative endopeptidase